MKPVVKREAYLADDHWFYEARVFRGDEQICSSEQFYSADDIRGWGVEKMELDKAKRGELESFTIDLEEEE